MSEQLTYSAFESRYQNKQLIGSGGFAKVYKVFDHAKNHYVALKVADVRPEFQKFTLKNEVELVNKLQHHRNIARYDACYRFNTGFTGDMDFALLKFYEYGNLEQFLKREEIEIQDKQLIVQGILNGISFLHQNNIIHRDIKAQNILMNREDGVWTPKITDFGLSRRMVEEHAVENTAIGMSYSYAAPEQIQDKKISKNVDLWAVGVMIYRIVMGHLPFRGEKEGDDKSTQSQLELSRKIVNLELPEGINDVPEPFLSVIKRCLVVDPTERAKTADELTDILLGYSPMEADKINIAISTNNSLKSVEETTELEDNEKTQVLASAQDLTPTPEVVPEPASKPEPELSPEPHPEPKPTIKNEPPPSPKAYAPPTEDYSVPKSNVTQFIPRDSSNAETSDEGELVTDFQPEGGDPEKTSKKWVWIVVALVVVGGLVAAIFIFKPFESGNQRPTRPEAGATDQGAASTTQAANDQFLMNLDSKIEAAGSDPGAQNLLSAEIQQVISDGDFISKYEPLFLQAKHLAYLELAKGDPSQENYRKAADSLRKAAEKAILHNSKAELLEDISNSESGAFVNLKTAGGGGYFNNIVSSLQP